MKRKVLAACSAASFTFLMAVPLGAANKPVTPAAQTHKTSAKEPARVAWPVETLSGQIMMVDPALNVTVVKGPDGVPFDMIVTHATRIKSGDRTLGLSDLSSDTNKNVSVKFVPERKGDVARSIQLNG